MYNLGEPRKLNIIAGKFLQRKKFFSFFWKVYLSRIPLERYPLLACNCLQMYMISAYKQYIFVRT
jgi:hypothetical protein